jgi:hypothetical protein
VLIWTMCNRSLRALAHRYRMIINPSPYLPASGQLRCLVSLLAVLLVHPKSRVANSFPKRNGANSFSHSIVDGFQSLDRGDSFFRILFDRGVGNFLLAQGLMMSRRPKPRLRGFALGSTALAFAIVTDQARIRLRAGVS